MKTAIYARVSTGEQETANQLVALEAWVEQRSYELYGVYQEQETAWKAGHQLELARLIKDARKGKFQLVVVWALDRLSREGSLAILQLIDKFKRYGVRVISFQESWTEAPGELAEVLYAIAGWAARMESQRRSERTKAGMARVKQFGSKSGRPIGRPRKGDIEKYRTFSKLKHEFKQLQ